MRGFLRAPEEWDPSNAHRIWKLHVPSYETGDAPVAYHRSLQEYLLESVDSLAKVGLRFRASSFAPCSYFVCREAGGAVGAIATHIDGILGCGRQITPARFASSWNIALEQ